MVRGVVWSVMDERVPSTIRELAQRWQDARDLLPGFAMLAEGRPVATQRLARETGLSEDELIEKLEAVRSERDAEGRIVDLFGMTLAPTHHRLTAATGEFYACCALWAHALPRFLDAHVDVLSTDPIDDTIVEIGVSPSGVRSRRPTTAMATVAIASDDEIAADVCDAFCRHVRHFSNPHNARSFGAGNDRRVVVDMDELDALAEKFTRIIATKWE